MEKYWTPTQNEAIIQYKNAVTQQEKNKIFSKYLYFPLKRMILNISYTKFLSYYNNIDDHIQNILIKQLKALDSIDISKIKYAQAYLQRAVYSYYYTAWIPSTRASYHVKQEIEEGNIDEYFQCYDSADQKLIAEDNIKIILKELRTRLAKTSATSDKHQFLLDLISWVEKGKDLSLFSVYYQNHYGITKKRFDELAYYNNISVKFFNAENNKIIQDKKWNY